MDLNQLNHVDFSNIADWPWVVKAVLILLFCALLAGGWYWFVTQDQMANLRRIEGQEAELRASFEAKQRLAANLPIHKEQLIQMEEFLAELLNQLPGSAEIAALLVDVSQTGLAVGLEFDLFQPTEEISKAFYAELPIQIQVTGTYHDLSLFVSGLAALPRIVTIHDMVITSQANAKVRGKSAPAATDKLSMRATVKTYRYLEEEGSPKGQGVGKGGKEGHKEAKAAKDANKTKAAASP